MIILEVVVIIAFLLFLVGAGVGIFLMAIDGTEVGQAINEQLANIIRGGKDKSQEKEEK